MSESKGFKKNQTYEDFLKSKRKLFKSIAAQYREMDKEYREIMKELEEAGIDTTPPGYSLQHPFEEIKNPTPPHPFRTIEPDDRSEEQKKSRKRSLYAIPHPFEEADIELTPPHPYGSIKLDN